MSILLESCAVKGEMNHDITGCLDDGKCTVEIIKDKEISLETTKLNEVVVNYLDATEKSVYTYEYNRTVDPKHIDGHYKEQVIFELQQNLEKLELSNQELQEIDLTFGRFCYCKGFTGYYKVKKGSFKLSDNKISISFKVDEVPQELSDISFKIK